MEAAQSAAQQSGTPGPASEVSSDSRNLSDFSHGNSDPAPVKEAPRKYKVKVDGAESEVDESELISGYSQAKAAQSRMRQANEIQKQYDALTKQITALKTKPESIFDLGKAIGVDFDDVAHKHVLSKMQWEMMTPEERADHQMRQEHASFKEQFQAQRQAQLEQQLQAMQTQAKSQIEDEIVNHFQKAGISPDIHVFERALNLMIASYDGPQPLGIEQAWKAAESQHGQFRTKVFQDSLRDMISKGQVPPDLAELVRKSDIEALKRQSPVRQAQPQETPRNEKGKFMTVDDWFNKKEGKQK